MISFTASVLTKRMYCFWVFNQVEKLGGGQKLIENQWKRQVRTYINLDKTKSLQYDKKVHNVKIFLGQYETN